MHLLTVVVACTAILVVAAERNSREEAICQPFLTSRATSPLIPNLKRNLTLDEDGEFACELVLQDTQLPVQIRATIHEGLAYLAVRHVQMGESRQKAAARHFSLLAELAPASFDLAKKSASFLLDPVVSDTHKALKYLHSALYGKASESLAKASADDMYTMRVMYIKSLGRTQQYEAAKHELQLLLEQFPYDFEAAAMLTTDPSQCSAAQTLLNEAYADITSHATSEYTGFAPPCSASGEQAPTEAWMPQVFTHMPSDAEFLSFVQRREPFLVRLGSAANLSQQLQWNTNAWRGTSGHAYLQKAVGEKEQLLVESRAQGDANAPSEEGFGFGLNAHRKVLPFTSVLENDFTNVHRNESLYLNIQLPSTQAQRAQKYRTPLHLLQQDIPVPAMLQHTVWDNVTEVNLWMGVARHRDATSKLHMDATDNLYVVLEGSKHFSIVSPQDALKVRTVSPTFAVSPDGMSFQFNVRKFAEYARAKMHNDAQARLSGAHNSTTDAAHTSTSTVQADVGASGETLVPQQRLFSRNMLQKHLVEQEIDYEVLNFHFATLDAKTPDLATAGVHCGAGPAQFDLQEGDMLYLPTGWFHQVTSKQGRHTAINYWWRALNWRNAVEYERAKSEALYEQLLGRL